MRARLTVLVGLTLAVAGCGEDEEAPPAASTPTPNPTVEAEATPAEPGSAANAFIGSIAVDPGDKTVMLGTGLGLFRAQDGAKQAERVVGTLEGGNVSSNLVIRYAGPGELIGSGHPEGPGDLPEDLGLMRSGDAGDTWESVSELGESDYHVLQVRGDRVVGVRVDETDVRTSTDGGRTFEVRTAPELPLDVEFDPAKPTRLVLTSQGGLFTSEDDGQSWRPRDATPSNHLAWVASDELYRADPGGIIKVSADGGVTWKDRGTIGIGVNELAADADGALYASVPGGEVRRSTDGGATWKRLLRLE